MTQTEQLLMARVERLEFMVEQLLVVVNVDATALAEMEIRCEMVNRGVGICDDLQTRIQRAGQEQGST